MRIHEDSDLDPGQTLNLKLQKVSLDPGSGMSMPDHISESLETIFVG
jgi:hypothetical protein